MGGENFENTATVKEEGSVIATGGVVDDEAGEEEEEICEAILIFKR